jgi:hypothetical protein
MQERMMYLGKEKNKKVSENFDANFDKYKKRAIDKGYKNPKLKILKEKSIVKFYVVVEIE